MSKSSIRSTPPYLYIQDKRMEPQAAQEGFHWKIEPVATIIHTNCKQKLVPCELNVSIDEAVFPFSRPL
jgi:ribosomal protein S2